MSRQPLKRAKLAIDGANVAVVDVPVDEIGDFISRYLFMTSH